MYPDLRAILNLYFAPSIGDGKPTTVFLPSSVTSMAHGEICEVETLALFANADLSAWWLASSLAVNVEMVNDAVCREPGFGTGSHPRTSSHDRLLEF